MSSALPEPSTAGLEALAQTVVQWQAAAGRHHLPWQTARSPYRVWLSEVMLQQTQVATATAYFERFMQRFPTLQSLADAELDAVLGMWSGLGYYSRARNLHRCAQAVVREHGGEFPRSAQVLQTLPGIGRSTAAAIAAFCFGERVAILDGNVRRVLSRVLAYGADLARPVHERALWDAATRLLPAHDLAQAMPAYTQGLMDLGATVCLARQPRCPQCPVAALCRAAQLGEPTRFPVKTRSLKRSAEAWWLLWLVDPTQAVWLQRRPERGVWARLYALPVFESQAALAEAARAAWPAVPDAALEFMPPVLHALTHKDLHLHPVRLQLPAGQAHARVGFDEPAGVGRWHAPDTIADLGLPAPLRRLLIPGTAR